MSESLVGSSDIAPVPMGISRKYVLMLVSLVLISAAIQLLVGFRVPFSLRGHLSSPPAVAPTFVGSSQSYSLRSGSAAAWRGLIWISATPSGMPGAWLASRNSKSSRLLTIDPKTGTVNDTGIAISPGPIGILVVGEFLYAVTTSVVYRIEDGQAIPRNPRRGLKHPSVPFVYKGRLAVIDKSHDGEHLLLTWQDGEWNAVGETQIPGSMSTSSIGTPDYTELTVVASDAKSFVFYSDWGTIYQREGLIVEPIQDAVSALSPVNRRPFYEDRLMPQAVAPSAKSGWRGMPNCFSLQFPSQEMLIRDELWAACVSTPNSGLLLYRFESGGWVLSVVNPAIVLTSFVVVPGPTNYLVTDNLRLFVVDDPTKPQLIGHSPTAVVQKLQVQEFVNWLLRNILAPAFLVLGMTWLMRKYRSPLYFYGHRHATHASILRRGMARAIDTVMLAYPAYLGLNRALRIDSRTLGSVSERGASDAIILAVLMAFGIWVVSVFAISVTEGCWGVTPGKWLCGIRTLRTTLRPCGFVRALARELLVYVDSVFLLAWQPGIMSIGLTTRWQRVGDLAADTVVVLNPDRTSWVS